MPRRPTPLPREVKAAAFTLAQGRSIGLGDKRMRGSDLQRPVRGVRQPADGAGAWPDADPESLGLVADSIAVAVAVADFEAMASMGADAP